MVSYYLLGQFDTFSTFTLAFFAVAIGAAIFKPVVVGTVARVTDERNSSMGFGIFYMMVNIGGFVGPIVAGVVRGLDWKYVFIACSFWIFLNLLLVIFFYKEPTTEAGSASARTFRKVLENTVEVLGNVRFFIAAFTIIVALMVANKGLSWFSWTRCCLIFIPCWLALNFIYDACLRRGSYDAHPGQHRPWYLKRMHVSNWRFAVFLLIMSGFWASFQQIYITLPEYIRDFTQTRPMLAAAETVLGNGDPTEEESSTAAKLATISDSERRKIENTFEELASAKSAGSLSEEQLSTASRHLLDSKIRLSPAQVSEIVLTEADNSARADRAIATGRQVNPEFIINIDAFAIILFQMLVSYFVGRFHRFTTIITGMIIAGLGFTLWAFAGDTGMIGPGGSVWIVALGIFIFAIGEMMASPTSQEYVGRIAPKDKTALYMGYYFVSMSLGFLLGGILSGELYGKLARDMQRPDLMWMLFAGLLFLTAFAFWVYNRFAVPRPAVNADSGPQAVAL